MILGRQDGKASNCQLESFLLSLVMLCTVSFSPAGMLAATPPHPQSGGSAALSASFHCPEELTSNDARQAALHTFIQSYTAQFPNNNVRDMMIFRYRLLVEHSCIQTLKSMLADVSPISEMLRLEDHDFGPKTEEFDPRARVWTVYFRKDGEPASLSDEDLIFNFYGWNPSTSPEGIAQALLKPRENLNIIWKFEAPDDLTKTPAYFFISETQYPGETFAYVNITKISSAGGGAYAVTLDKKITDTSFADIDKKCKAWLISEEGKASTTELGHIGADPAWEQHFAQTAK